MLKCRFFITPSLKFRDFVNKILDFIPPNICVCLLVNCGVKKMILVFKIAVKSRQLTHWIFCEVDFLIAVHWLQDAIVLRTHNHYPSNFSLVCHHSEGKEIASLPSLPGIVEEGQQSKLACFIILLSLSHYFEDYSGSDYLIHSWLNYTSIKHLAGRSGEHWRSVEI